MKGKQERSSVLHHACFPSRSVLCRSDALLNVAGITVRLGIVLSSPPVLAVSSNFPGQQVEQKRGLRIRNPLLPLWCHVGGTRQRECKRANTMCCSAHYKFCSTRLANSTPVFPTRTLDCWYALADLVCVGCGDLEGSGGGFSWNRQSRFSSLQESNFGTPSHPFTLKTTDIEFPIGSYITKR